ncbi:MAG TPA: peptide chain release factor-like protein, partial [Planctomycetaceae bacterium]
VESAIRLTHLPTGVAVHCQSERSQHQNRALARKLLTAKLYQMEVEKRDAEIAARRGEKSKIGFGGQTIRHYVLNPDRYVKDDRSGQRHTNPDVVLDGGLDPFIESYLRWSIGQENGKAS